MDVKPPKKRRTNRDIRPPAREKMASPADQTPRRDAGSQSKMAETTNQAKPVAESSNSNYLSNVKRFIFANKILILYSLITFSLVFFLYLYKISSFPKATSLDTVVALNVQSFSDLSSNLIFGPQKFLDYLLLKLNLASPVGLRLSSVFFSIAALVIFFLINKRWLSLKVSILATLLFATSTWTLTQTRDAGFINIFFLVIPTLLLAGSLVRRKPDSIIIFPLMFLLAILTYTPGFIWFLLFTVAFYYKNILIMVNKNSLKKSAAMATAYFLPIIPLVYFMANNIASFKLWLGLPTDFKFSLSEILANAAELPGQLVALGVDRPLIWLFGTPVIDAATGVLALIGMILASRDSLHPTRRLSLAGFLLLSVCLLVLGGSVYISLLLPLIYIFAALGIYYLLDQWYSIFPRNPFARTIGYLLMSGLVAAISFYHVSRYFIIWPKNDQVIEVYEKASSGTIESRSNNNFIIPRSENHESR